MNYRLYKLAFPGAVHFGKRNLSEGECSCCADTLFSALCQEAQKIGGHAMEELYRYAKEGRLLFSDLFPYMGDDCYIPKPMRRIEVAERSGDSVVKKAFKKLKYIPMDQLSRYLNGTYDVLHAASLSDLGHFEMKTAVSLRGEAEPAPYRVGVYSYKQGNGLYLIVGYQEESAWKLAEDLLERLSFSGIGGKRSSGLGRFELLFGKLPEDFCRRLTADGARYMSLSVSLPRGEELEEALQDAEYLLGKRSGFVASERYAPEQTRKKDLYVFQAGSCFSARFQGDVYDVSGGGGAHPVYRYAKPMLMEV